MTTVREERAKGTPLVKDCQTRLCGKYVHCHGVDDTDASYATAVVGPRRRLRAGAWPAAPKRATRANTAAERT